jgi:hypothetical protein
VADLITVGDLTARATLSAEQLNRAPALIADASALARLESGNTFETVDNDVIVLRANAGKLVLPNPPITAVTQVKAIGLPPIGDLVLPAGTWAFDKIDTITLQSWSWVINLPADWLDDAAGTGSFEITYSHGYATVPPEIIGTVARMVLRCVTSPSIADGVTGENIGQYGYQMSQQGGTSGSGVIVTAADRAVLRNPKFRRRSRTIETPVG